MLPDEHNSDSIKRRSNVIYCCSHNNYHVLNGHLSSKLFAYLSDGRYLFSGGHWDSSIRVTSIDNGCIVCTLKEHKDIVTCLSIGKSYDKRWLISGSQDCSVIIWEISLDRALKVNAKPLHVLLGHSMPVNCIAVSVDMNIVLSGSDDGFIMMYDLREGNYIRSIHNDVSKGEETSESNKDKKYSVTWIGISSDGYIISYSATHQTLSTFSLVGTRLATKKLCEHLFCFAISDDGKVLVHGGSSCLIAFRWVRAVFPIFLS